MFSICLYKSDTCNFNDDFDLVYFITTMNTHREIKRQTIDDDKWHNLKKSSRYTARHHTGDGHINLHD